MTECAKITADSIEPGKYVAFQEERFMVHVFASLEGVCAIILTEKDYPPSVGEGLVRKIVDDFTGAHPRSKYAGSDVRSLGYPQLKEVMEKYQSPPDPPDPPKTPKTPKTPETDPFLSTKINLQETKVS